MDETCASAHANAVYQTVCALMSISLIPSRVERFYEFMTERENIRLRRLLGWPREQWTLDPVFQKYSFTNVKREHDRTSTRLMKEFYEPHILANEELEADALDLENPDDLRTILINCAIARYFGTVESMHVMGWTESWDTERRNEILGYGAQGDLTFTSAYIIPACGQSRPKYEIVCDILDGIWGSPSAIYSGRSGHTADLVVTAMSSITGWQHATQILTMLWGVGSFMAKEILLDYVMATGLKPADWQTWTPVGPGGRRGASRVLYGDKRPISEALALDVIREVYAERGQYWRSDFVELDLTDIQFQFCEIDKHSRVAEGRRPKRQFKPTIDDITKAVIQIDDR